MAEYLPRQIIAVIRTDRFCVNAYPPSLGGHVVLTAWQANRGKLRTGKSSPEKCITAAIFR